MVLKSWNLDSWRLKKCNLVLSYHESSFSLYSKIGKVYVWIATVNCYNWYYMISTVKQENGSIVITIPYLRIRLVSSLSSNVELLPTNFWTLELIVLISGFDSRYCFPTNAIFQGDNVSKHKVIIIKFSRIMNTNLNAFPDWHNIIKSLVASASKGRNLFTPSQSMK